MKKYEFTGETKLIAGVELRQIRSLVDIEEYGVRKGDIGGWLEKESNLNRSGNAWVSGNAHVSGDAHVSGSAQVYGNDWKKSPLYIQGTRYGFTVSDKNKISVGCQTHTFYAWNKNWKKIASKYGFSEEEQKEYILYFNLA